MTTTSFAPGDHVLITHPSGNTEEGIVRSVQCNRPVIDFPDGTNCDVAPHQITLLDRADGCYFYAVEASFTTTRRLTPEQLEAIVAAITAQLDEPTDDDGEVIDAGISNVEGMVVTEGDRIG